MKYSLIFLYVLISFSTYSQEEEKKKETQKKGWSFGLLPVVAFDSDIGFKYGGLINLYDYGDGTQYPDYKHSIYLEWSQTTKGSGIKSFKYDSKYIIPGIRFSATGGLFTEQMMDFYGFNGYETYYNSNYTNTNQSDYLSRAYYKFNQEVFRLTTDFTGNFENKKYKWVLGLAYFNTSNSSVNTKKLNEGKNNSDTLASVDLIPGLYEKYIQWGIIQANEKNGGTIGNIKLGIIYDTRDNEPNPMKGIWTEAILIGASGFNQTTPMYLQSSFTYRQYFTLYPKVLNLAARIGFQNKLAGTIPYYMLAYVHSSNKPITKGLGGYYNLRGIMRSRVVGDGFVYNNLEIRWKILRTLIGKNNFYIALSSFSDLGMVTQKYNYSLLNTPEQRIFFNSEKKESIHQSIGGGIHFALNDNFIVTIDYGKALNKQDGDSGIYIDLDFLF